MATHEVTKHSRKISKILFVEKGKIWKKLLNLSEEIVIIVLALLFSLYLHDANEAKHHHKEEKLILAGIKTDLQADIKELTNDLKSYEITGKAFSFFLDSPDSLINRDKLALYSSYAFSSTTVFLPNDSRFEGIKASGQLNYIRNKELLNDILDLYQEKIKEIVYKTNLYSTVKINYLMAEFDKRYVKTSGSSNFAAVIKDPVIVS